MSTLNYDIHSFLTLTNGQSVTISGNQGWSFISIENDGDSTDNVTITGSTDKIGGFTPNQYTLKPGKAITLGSGEDAGVDDVTITAGASCTLYIAAVKRFENI